MTANGAGEWAVAEIHQDAVRDAADAARRELEIQDVDVRALAMYVIVNDHGNLSVISLEPAAERLDELGNRARGPLVRAYQEALERLGSAPW